MNTSIQGASSALVPVFSGSLQGQSVQLVDARELHAFLESGKDFSNWIKDRIEQYGFVENQDFLIRQNGRIKTGRGGDRRSQAYHLTLDMAKELAMVERSDKGRQARRYFIECERRAAAAEAAPQTLPSPASVLSPALREHIARTAHETAMRHYNTLHATLSALAIDSRLAGVDEAACLARVSDYARQSDHAVRDNLVDLDTLSETLGAALETLQRIEQRSMASLYHRFVVEEIGAASVGNGQQG